MAYRFDDLDVATDVSQNDYLLMPSSSGMIEFFDYPIHGLEEDADRLIVEFGSGDYQDASAQAIEVDRKILVEPEVVFEFESVDRHFEISNAMLGAAAGEEVTYDAQGSVISSTPFPTSQTLTNETITFYQQPYEIIFDVEIAFLFPWAVVFQDFVRDGQGFLVFIEAFIFVSILLVGFSYVWVKGDLDWVKMNVRYGKGRYANLQSKGENS